MRPQFVEPLQPVLKRDLDHVVLTNARPLADVFHVQVSVILVWRRKAVDHRVERGVTLPGVAAKNSRAGAKAINRVGELFKGFVQVQRRFALPLGGITGRFPGVQRVVVHPARQCFKYVM